MWRKCYEGLKDLILKLKTYRLENLHQDKSGIFKCDKRMRK